MEIKMKSELDLIAPSAIRAFDEEVSSIEGIIKLTLGEPDFDTPEHIKEAAVQSLKNGRTSYAPSNGTEELKVEIQSFLKRNYDIDYSLDEIIVTIGASEAISSSLGAILNAGDEVIIPTPIFPAYTLVSLLNGAKPIFVDTSEHGFKLTVELVRETLTQYKNVKCIVLNFPNNPTGVTYSKEELEDLADEIKKHNVFVLSDEIYSELCYEEAHTSIAKLLPEQTILVNGLSKTFAMTGWRLGYVCAKGKVVSGIAKYHQFMVTCSPTMLQDAACEALKNGQSDIEMMRTAYHERRDFIAGRMEELGLEGPNPDGAFYAFIKIPSHCNQNSLEFCYELAEEAKVALIPGSSFGPGGEGYVRMSYAASMEELVEAMSRIEKFLKKKEG